MPEKIIRSLAMTSNSSARPCLVSFSYTPELNLALSWPMQVILHIITCPTLRAMIGGKDEKAWAALRMKETEPLARKGKMFSSLIA
jgi:hypothetical protein